MCRTQYAGCGVFIKTVSHNTTSDTNDVTYTFGYDAFGKPTTVSVGSQVLSTNSYDTDRQQKLRRVTYANGQYVEYNYDDFGRKTSMKYNWDPGTRHDYKYGANGQASKVKDWHMNRSAWTEYDEANRPKRMILRDDASGATLNDVKLTYDNLEHVGGKTEKVSGGSYSTTYEYDWDNRPTEIRYGSSTCRVKYTYDGQGRLLTRRMVNGSADQTAAYGYLASGEGIPNLDTVSSTNLICSITQPGISYVYEYAGNTDNLTSEERRNGSYAGKTTYVYDTLGQLTRVNDPKDTRGGSTGTTWVYTYDRGGNILNRKRYAYTTGTVGTVQQTISYTYNSAWKDKLATYNGITLTHDAGGNLTNDGTWTYSWQAGRELLKMEKTGTKIVYDYDHNGMRICKTVAGVATDYTVSGKHVTHLVKGSDWMHFFYDGQGRPAIVNYNNATYHYLYNLQGDVIGLIDTSGNVVVEYKYDAWGKIIARTGSLASTLGYLNPFRYRGYVYDEETGLYYLRSRYYNPEWGRFINADALLGKRGVLLGHNLFTYCNNAPSVRNDPSGRRSIWVGIKEFVGNFLQLSGQQAVLSYEQNLQAFRSVTSGASGILLEWKGYPVAQDMFNHFLFGEGADYENTAMLEDNLSHNTEMIDAIKLQCPTDGYEITNGDVVFKDGDMHFAIGKADFTAKVYQKNGRWHADVVLTDKYNFDEWRLVKNGISLSNAANDFGTFLEGIKIGEAYSVVVSFTCIW